MDPKSKETARRQSLSLLCARMHMLFFAFRGLLCFGLALAVEFFELFQLFRALDEWLGVLEEHGVAEGEEAVLLFDGGLVGAEDEVAAGEGADEHDEGGFWQVEVGDDGVDDLEVVAGVDEDASPAALAGDLVFGGGGGLEGADARRADGDDAVPGLLGLHDELGGLVGDAVVLLVHLVLLDVVDADGAEGAEADVQGDEAEVDAHLAQLLHLLFGEVQAGGRGGGGALLAVVDGLVALLVLEFLVDVGRQRRLAEAVEDLLEDTVIVELDDAAAKVGVLGDGARELRAEADDVARLGFLAGLDERLPVIGVEAAQEEDFDFAARLVAVADEAGRHDARVVEDQGVAGLEVFLEVVEVAMLDGLLYGVEDHEARGVARLDRHLGDALFWQVVIKIG